MHQQCHLCVLCPKKWTTPMNGKREGLRRWLQMENVRCRSENHVPISAVLKNLVYPMSLRRRWVTDCKSEMPDHQDRTREDLKVRCPKGGEPRPGIGRPTACHGCPGHQETGRIKKVPEWLQPFKEGLSGDLPRLTQCHEETVVYLPRKQCLCRNGGS